jgi:hypothetical protein
MNETRAFFSYLIIQKLKRHEITQKVSECVWDLLPMPIAEEIAPHILSFDDFDQNKKHSIERSEETPKRHKK